LTFFIQRLQTFFYFCQVLTFFKRFLFLGEHFSSMVIMTGGVLCELHAGGTAGDDTDEGGRRADDDRQQNDVTWR